MNNLLLFLVSLCFSEFIHNMMEIWGMREKVSWLDAAMSGKEHSKWPISIDATAKRVIAFHATVLLLVSGLVYFLLKWLNFSETSLIILGIVILITSYIITTWKVDKFHTEIGKLTAYVKKQNK